MNHARAPVGWLYASYVTLLTTPPGSCPFRRLAHDAERPPFNAIQYRNHQDAAVLQLNVHCAPAAAGRDAGTSGDIDVGIDVALRDASLNQSVMPGRSGSWSLLVFK